jgi:hypothetical protein
MLTFGTLLNSAGLDPATVRLVRHRHASRYQRTVYLDAIHRHPRFEQYQAGQGNPRVISMMCSAAAIASFVVDPAGRTVFVGMWRVRGTHPGQSPDPYMPPSKPGPHSTVIELERMPDLDGYAGRLVVDWGGGERAWVQYANRRVKEIVELRRRIEEPRFPGIGEFSCGLHEVDSLPDSWQELLRTARGVYLLVHRVTGAQYVGSAAGSGGFLGRWRGYADGHGGNLALRELGHAADNYDAWILETAGSSATVDDICALESHWKNKLGSRAQGLNRN